MSVYPRVSTKTWSRNCYYCFLKFFFAIALHQKSGTSKTLFKCAQTITWILIALRIHSPRRRHQKSLQFRTYLRSVFMLWLKFFSLEHCYALVSQTKACLWANFAISLDYSSKIRNAVSHAQICSN